MARLVIFRMGIVNLFNCLYFVMLCNDWLYTNSRAHTRTYTQFYMFELMIIISAFKCAIVAHGNTNGSFDRVYVDICMYACAVIIVIKVILHEQNERNERFYSGSPRSNYYVTGSDQDSYRCDWWWFIWALISEPNQDRVILVWNRIAKRTFAQHFKRNELTEWNMITFFSFFVLSFFF